MNKMYEYMSQHPDSVIEILQSSEYHDNRMNDRKFALKHFEYEKHFDIHEHDYLVKEEDYNNFMKYLKDNNIRNEGGYIFIDCYRVVCYTNEIHNKIIKNKFNVICC